jgi:protein ImuA
VTIASPKRLDRTQARRLQLAAEQGGGVGILMRTLDRNAEIYSAVTRWLVKPVPGERAVQKWKIQLLHGHGGRVGESFILERNRETHLVRATAEFSHRPLETRRRA